MTEPTLYRWSDVEAEQLNPLLQRQFIHGEQAMLTRFVLSKGAIIPLHSHPNEQISYIVSGSLEFDFGGGDTASSDPERFWSSPVIFPTRR